MQPVVLSSFVKTISRMKVRKVLWLDILVVSGYHVTYRSRCNYRSYVVSNELGHERQV